MPATVFALGVGSATFQIMIAKPLGSGAPRDLSGGKRTITLTRRERTVAQSLE
jgi:hypothetical protein